jgi:hypothetical protein
MLRPGIEGTLAVAFAKLANLPIYVLVFFKGFGGGSTDLFCVEFIFL